MILMGIQTRGPYWLSLKSRVSRPVLHFPFHHPWRLPGVRSPMSQPYTPTPRTRLVREADRAVYDREAAYRILDEGFLCHVGFVVDGQPFVIPTSYGRKDDSLYIHGSAASRMLRQMKESVPVCVTVTLLDGLVLARSIFNHSMNYRSVVVLGKATLVDDPEEKIEALRLLSEHIIPGRWADARQPNERELKATSVLRVPIEEFSAKVRQGPVVDDEEDYSFPSWAGVVPLEMVAGAPIDDARLPSSREVPAYAKNYSRRI
jgi:nitroimidazol reductase NimA-like FMN-containing flavoprotein (pyridoxamine 5'-phosphate oxidase superfamily)